MAKCKDCNEPMLTEWPHVHGGAAATIPVVPKGAEHDEKGYGEPCTYAGDDCLTHDHRIQRSGEKPPEPDAEKCWTCHCDYHGRQQCAEHSYCYGKSTGLDDEPDAVERLERWLNNPDSLLTPESVRMAIGSLLDRLKKAEAHPVSAAKALENLTSAVRMCDRCTKDVAGYCMECYGSALATITELREAIDAADFTLRTYRPAGEADTYQNRSEAAQKILTEALAKSKEVRE